MIQRLFDEARETMGHARAKELRLFADMKNASRGLYVSKSGLLPYSGGIKGIDFEEYTSVTSAHGSNNGLLPGAGRDINGKTKKYSYSYLLELIETGNDGITAFIPVARSGNLIQTGTFKGKCGYVVQFSPFLFSVFGDEKYQYFTGWKYDPHFSSRK